jgi:predicted anti-sigma-YlaC factor YlaD
MDCKQVYRYLCDNLDENIRSARCRAIRRHLECCPDCRAYLDSLKKTVLLYRQMPSPRVPARTHRELVKLLRLEGSPKARRSGRSHALHHR